MSLEDSPAPESSAARAANTAPELYKILDRINTHATLDFLGGPRLLKFNWVINFQKGATFFWVLALMFFFENFSVAAYVYLGLHGSYGFCWLLKDNIFPDPKWQSRVTFGGAFVAIAAVLGPYWAISWILISDVLGPLHVGAALPWLAAAIFIHTLGIAIMLSADAQKFYTLRYKRGLITDGMFAKVRHPNYLGEMMIYGSYALVAWHWVPWAILAFVWIGLFWVNIQMKEGSMSRYPEWAAYKKRTGMLLPKIF